MIGRIARKELLETIRDGRFRVLAAVVLVLGMTSIAARWSRDRDVQRQHSEAQQATRAQWLNQPAKNPHSAAHYGMYAFKPKSRLSMIDTGVDPYVGVSAWLEAHKQNEFAYRPAQDGTSAQRFGDLTAAEGMMVTLLRFLSPALIMQDALNDISGTGTARHRHFLAQVAGYHEAWRAYFVPRIFRGDQLVSFAGLPRFTLVDEPTGAVAGRVGASLATLLAAALIIGTAGLRLLRRYPIAG